MSSDTTETIKISCPHCGQHLAIDESMLGMELECPTCGQSFTATRPEEQLSEEAMKTNEEAVRSEAEVSAPSEIRESVSPKEEGSSAETTTTKFREHLGKLRPAKNRSCLLKSKLVLASVWRRAKELFLRLPERVQGAMMALVVFLVAIAIVAGKGESGHPEKSRSNGDSPTATQKALPRPDIKPLKGDKESARWVCASSEGDWKEIMRYPEKYKGKAFYLKGKVTEIRYPDPNKKNHRGNVWVQDEKWDEEWIVVFDDERTILPGGNILKYDEICVFGTFEKIHEWTGKNGYNATVSGKNPVLMARLISTDDPDDVMESYEEEGDKEVEEASTDRTSSSAAPNPTESEKNAMGRVYYVYAKQEILMSQLASAGQNEVETAAAHFFAGLGGAGILNEVDTEGCPQDFADAWKDFVAGVGGLKIIENGYNFMVAAVRHAQMNGQYIDMDTRRKLLEMEQKLPSARRDCEEKMKAFAIVCQRYGLENLQQWSLEAYKRHEGDREAKLFKSDR